LCGHPHREVTEDEMKSNVQCFVLIVSAVAMLAGCASTAPANEGTPYYDAARVKQIENTAHRFNMEVHWINYPRKSEQ
jgi:outer membrane murein-binding lipoprotein Lpp